MEHDFSYYRGKRVLITGGLGFLGSNLACALVGHGASVSVYDALLPLYGGNMFNVEPVKDRVEVIIADIRDRARIGKAVAGKDVVFNIAAQTSHVDSMTEPLLDVEMNCAGQINLLEAVRNSAPECRIVYAGSRAQYGKIDRVPVTEDMHGRPTDIYSANKIAGEMYHFVYSSAFGLKFTSLRISNAYGPRHQMKHGKYGVLNWFIRLAIEGKKIKVFGTGAQMRDYHYVDDVTGAFLLAGMKDEALGEAFNLGGPEPVRFVDMVKTIVETAGSGGYEFVPWPADRKAIEVGDFTADTGKISRALGWRPRMELGEGIRRTVDFYRRFGKEYWR